MHVSDYFVFVYTSSPHNLGNVDPVSTSCPITLNTLLKHHHVSSSLLCIYSMPAYYRYLTKVHDGQPFYLRLSE